MIKDSETSYQKRRLTWFPEAVENVVLFVSDGSEIFHQYGIYHKWH